MKSSLVRVALVVVPMFVAACGGGGGSGDDTSAPVAITSSNAPAVAAEALGIATNTEAAGVGRELVTGVEVSGAGSVRSAGPMRLAAAARELLATQAPGAGTLATAAAISVNCAVSGTIAKDGHSATPDTPVWNTNDWVQIVANNCTDSDNVVVNGSIKVSILAGSYNPESTTYPKRVTMRIEVNDYSITEGGVTEVFNGDLTMALTTTATSGVVDLSAASLSSSIGSHTVTVSDYSLFVTEAANSSSMTINATVQTSNSRLGPNAVTYSIETPDPLTVTSTGVVTVGSIKVTGAQSALLLKVTGSDSFSLEVDTNGDGAPDSNSTVERSELDALM